MSDKRIDFALRDDIGFSNGFGAMTAEDVKFSFERIISPELESSNKPDMGSLSRVEVTGERTGTIVLSEPFAPLWSIALPYITGNIVSKKAVEKAAGWEDWHGAACRVRSLPVARVAAEGEDRAQAQPRLAR